MKRYEYHQEARPPSLEIPDEGLLRLLNELGRKGWQLVAISKERKLQEGYFADVNVYTFAREIERGTA